MKDSTRKAKKAARRSDAPGGAAARPARLVRWWAVAALLAVTALAYSSAVKAPFMWDDVQGITDNATARTLWPLSVPLHPPRQSPVAGRPVVNLSLAVNYVVNEWLGIDQSPDPDGPDKTVGYHVFNVLVHLLSGALLFGIIRRTLRQRTIPDEWMGAADPVAFVACALWLLHPLQTEALNYVIQRTELMMSACYLGTLYASIRAWSAGTARARQLWYVAAVFICLSGMWSKEVMISAPLAVMLYDRAFMAGSWRSLLRFKDGRAAFYLALAATAAVVVISVVTGDRNGSTGFGHGITWYGYLYTQAWAIGHYLWLVILPAGTTIDYGLYLVQDARGIPAALILIAAAIATLAIWIRDSKWLGLGFLGACFFLILGPSSSVMPIATEIVAERRFYLPLAAVLVAAVIGVEAARRRFAPSLPPARLAWSGVFIAAACGVATFVRGKKFNDPELLWRESIAAVPNNARAYDNLAFLLMSRHQGRLDEADTLLRKAMAVDSTFLHAWINLASIRATQGKYDEDIALLRHVLQLTPDDTLANRHLGIAYLNSDRPTEALPYIEHYVSLDSTGDGLLMLGSTLLTVGKPDSAIAALKAALGREAQRVATLGLLGSAYSEIGRPRDAEPFLRQLTVLSPASGAAWGALALNQAQLGQVDQARAAVKIAGEFAAGDPAVFIFTGRALAQLGDTRGAREQFRKALSLDPANADAASALRSLGDGPTQ